MKRAPTEPYRIEDFIDNILVVCPRCSDMANVTSTGRPTRARLVCTQCGLAKSLTVSSYIVGDAQDPYFRLPLWLQSSCSAHTLWAYNSEHLAFLKQYIEATDRHRPARKSGEGFNRLLASRLPRWMQLSKNRSEIAKAIAALESKL
jgi:hypothetical protein